MLIIYSLFEVYFHFFKQIFITVYDRPEGMTDTDLKMFYTDFFQL